MIGFGAGHIDRLEEAEAAALLHGVVDLGVEVIDTARSYGSSEERIGRYLAKRDVRISTKVGYGIDGHQDWTPGCVRAGIEEARRRLRTDVIDIVHLHSCSVHTLASEGVVDALLEARDAGHIKRAAYSGDNTELTWAIDSNQFDVLQTTINVCDTAGIDRIADTDAMVMVKRPLANAVWRFDSRPDAFDLGIYFDRWQEIKVLLSGDPVELALRFAAHAPNVDIVLVGTTKLAHLERAVEVAQLGPLPTAWVSTIRHTSVGWPQVT